MYPYELFWGMDLYSLLITVGIISCMILIRVLSDRRGYAARWQNFLLVTMVVAVILGYGTAVLMQGLYNIAEIGHFELTNSTGSTFYGGLMGGAAVFLAIYFGVGHFLFPDGYHKSHLRALLDIAACCITMAHGFGRLGCLMAGCCYGRATEAWYGIYMVGLGHKVVPVQLYEAIFLFVLSAFLIVRFVRNKPFCMPIYMLTYGVWRFFIEYLRDDERGGTIVPFLSPSQLVSVVLIAGSVLVIWLEYRAEMRKAPATRPTAELTAELTAESASNAGDPVASGAEPPEEGGDTTRESVTGRHPDTPDSDRTGSD